MTKASGAQCAPIRRTRRAMSASLLCALMAGGAAAEEKPLLIGWGQTVPDTRMLCEHASYYEDYLPFDGIVIPLNQEKFAGRYGDTGCIGVPPEKWPVIGAWVDQNWPVLSKLVAEYKNKLDLGVTERAMEIAHELQF